MSLSIGCAALTLVAAIAAPSQQRHPVSGRRIAEVMGHQGAVWLERAEREREEAPSKAIAALAITPGQIIADIGAGSGYYSMLLAKAVGPTGRVYATDIQPEMLAILEKRIDKDGVANIFLIQSTETETRLPDNSIDLAIMVDVYHELAQPEALLKSVRRALKKDGRLVLLEFRKEDPRVPIREEHKMSVREARMELEAEGFVFDRQIDVLPWQHILIFR